MTASVAVAGLLGSMAEADAHRDRAETLADVPGVLAPLADPARELWARDISLAPGLVSAGGNVVGVELGPKGRASVVAIDPHTGAVVWRTSPAAQLPGAAITCATPAPAARERVAPQGVVACLVFKRSPARLDGASADSLLVMDARTGQTLLDRRVEPTASVTVVEDDLVLSRVGDDGMVEVQRTDPRMTEVRWLVRRDITHEATATLRGDTAVRLITRGLLRVGRGERAFHLFADGRPADPPGEESGGTAVPPRPGAVVAVPDDGSLADTVLVRAETGELVVALDARSGERRWTTRSDIHAAVAVLDGDVFTGHDGTLTRIDGRTGDVVWRAAVSGLRPRPAVTDGRVLVVTVQSAGREGAVVRAYGLDDGLLHWSVDPGDPVRLVELAGRLYGTSENRLVALG